MARRATTMAKNALLAWVSRLTGRHAILLPPPAGAADVTLDLRAPYRVEGQLLSVDLRERDPGWLRATLLGYVGHFPAHRIWTGPPRDYRGPATLQLDLEAGTVSLGGEEWGRVPLPLPGRRFCWQLELTDRWGRSRSRLTGHYRALRGSAIGAGYFSGENYVDHEAESAGDHADILAALERHQAREPVLEVGCATGGMLAELVTAGFDAVGVDFSEWAVGRATERLGAGRAWLCDFEREPLPAEVKAKAPFGALVLAAVLEHFRDPFGVLAKLSDCARPGTVMVIITSNAGSLSHLLSGPDWEGYFDWTHLGVDQVTVRSLREELPKLGWRVRELTTRFYWDGNADPTHAALRDWWAYDARFRRLLVERELGDFINCVAVRE
ncbi:MAG TPA: class I SAM-dependent methyltransferase [Candidatus Bathyarchaeia archaeon]|nr:class I SAM-dependent methyltransferase [Candidatus Bathyarchaeia archaeon]